MNADPRPCRGQNANICAAEGCYGEACVTTSPPILTATLAAFLIQRAAADAGLPLPFEASARRGETHLQFHLDELTTWALWLEATIETRRVGNRFHHVAHVDWQDWAFRLVAVTAAEVAA